MKTILAIVIGALFLVRCADNADHSKQAQHITLQAADTLWFKNAVIYTLDVEVFKDSDGDGVGDFNGLSEKLDYIHSLGANVIWLAPFQPSPNKDDGYDVSDYTAIDKRLGSMTDFENFMRKAATKNIRVIFDLVVNHTSVDHHWFQEARKGEQSPYYRWFNWSKQKPANYDVGMAFPGVQSSIWTFDSSARAYYYHRFYEFQPDLNAQNPAVA